MENKDEKSNKKNNQLEFKVLEEIKNKVFYWIAELNSVFDLEENGRHILKKETDYYNDLISSLEKLNSKAQEIETSLSSIIISSKHFSNYKRTLERLLHSLDLEQLKIISNNPLKGDLISLLKNNEIDMGNKIFYISLINKSLENNWVAFNQSYARLLFKLVNMNQLKIKNKNY